MGWNSIGEGGGGDDFLKIEPGSKVVMHVLSEEPFSFWQIYNEQAKRSAVVPDDFPGKKSRRHAFLVWLMQEKQVKVWIVSNTTGKAIRNIYEGYGNSLGTVDLQVSRIGKGLDTEYGVVPLPTKFKEEWLADLQIPVLEEMQSLFAADEETINKIAGGQDPTTEFNEPAQEAAEEVPTEEPTPESEPEPEPAPAPAKTAARPTTVARPAANGHANGNGASDARIKLVRQVMHVFATKPKYKDQKARAAVLKQVSKKQIVSQLSADELAKLIKLVNR